MAEGLQRESEQFFVDNLSFSESIVHNVLQIIIKNCLPDFLQSWHIEVFISSSLSAQISL